MRLLLMAAELLDFNWGDRPDQFQDCCSVFADLCEDLWDSSRAPQHEKHFLINCLRGGLRTQGCKYRILEAVRKFGTAIERKIASKLRRKHKTVSSYQRVVRILLTRKGHTL